MTYLQYHLVFIVPPLLALLLLTWRATRGGASVVGAFREAGWARRTLALFPLIPLVYTTPWDNYLVYKAVWSYPPERVLGRIGYVPYEEYAFFILQTLITGLWLAFWLRRGADDGSAEARVSPHAFTRWGQAALWLGVAFVGVLLLGHEHTFYLGLILAWACPVLSGLSAFGGDLVFGRPRVYWLAVLPPTLYLWATDYFAIQNGIWGISPRYTLGWNLGGVLPAEEMAFFFITNLLVVTGLLSFLHPEALNRVNRLAALIRTGTLRPWMVLTALYALSKIPVPLWPAGFPLLGTLGTGLLFLAALSFAWERVGAARALLLAGLAFAAGLGVELLGSRTGLPFGQYSYAHAPGLLLLGVPLLVPLGWFAMTLAAALLARGKPWLTGLLLVAWDVGLEPLMTAQGFWRWDDPAGLWAGAPIQNFLGWFVVGAVLAFVMREIGEERCSRMQNGQSGWTVLRRHASRCPSPLPPRICSKPRFCPPDCCCWVQASERRC
ncbi:carotenoid biosynthesis protein [Deinococcus sp. KNUC1210]|uniref:carotenoid biosynthesis protein n=1 Tax=Deinococcus sp. KNUC1210 TaxID=2917691 RepID=UPI002715115E|nr:carotenoid biosynthesis protein [Deinococcus sp. KNUC1210]